MESIKIVKYTSDYYNQWNDFVAQSKNATFLFHRDFMEYHQDRFEDFSLLIYKGQKLLAVFPANKVAQTIYSHQGLTYGGLLFNTSIKVIDEVYVFKALQNHLRGLHFKEINIKQLPIIYYSKISQALDYFYFQFGGQILKREMNLAIDFSSTDYVSKSKRKHFIKNSRVLSLNEGDFTSFWNMILIPRLNSKYNTLPVHTLDEILYLKSKFPKQIKQYNAYYQNEIIAGVTLFDTGSVVKSQYGATSEIGEKMRALDFIFISLIDKFKKENKRYFDMGIVNEDFGQKVNYGLLNQKEELGCSSFYQDYYTFKL